MGEKPFLDDYSGQSTDELIALAEQYRVDSVVLAFESALSRKWEIKRGAGLSDEELDVLAVEALEREVNNGGYRQFFVNTSRIFARIVPLSLARIGCPKTLEITQEAIRIAGTPDPDRLHEIMNYEGGSDEEIFDLLDECDSRYYASGEDIGERLFEFIVNNHTAIDLSGATLR